MSSRSTPREASRRGRRAPSSRPSGPTSVGTRAGSLTGRPTARFRCTPGLTRGERATNGGSPPIAGKLTTQLVLCTTPASTASSIPRLTPGVNPNPSALTMSRRGRAALGPEDILVRGQQLGGLGGLPVQAVLDPPPTAGAERLRAGRIGEQLRDLAGIRLGVLTVDEDRVAIGAQEARQLREGGRDDGDVHLHVLEHL